MKAGEIFVDLRLRKDKFDKGISDSKQSLKLFALEALASVYLLDRFAEKSTNAATKLTNLSRASGIMAQDLKKYGLAANLLNAGISAEEASGQLAEFGKNLYSIQKWGQGNFEGFNKLQIGWQGKESLQIIKEISEKIKGLSDVAAAERIAAFGFSPEMLPFFRASRQEIDKITSGITLQGKDIAKLEEADRLIGSIKANWSFLQDKLVLQLSPALEEFAQILKDAGMNLSGVPKSGMEKYKNFNDYINQRGWGGFLLDSIKKGLPVTGGAASNLGNTALLGLKTIFGGKGTSNTGTGSSYDMSTPEGRSRALLYLYGDEQNNMGAMENFKDMPKTPEVTHNSNTKNITVNNTNHIHGGDAEATAGMIGDDLQKKIKHATSDQNNGAF